MIQEVKFVQSRAEENAVKNEKIKKWIRDCKKGARKPSREEYFKSWKDFRIICDGEVLSNENTVNLQTENEKGLIGGKKYEVQAIWPKDGTTFLKLLGHSGYVDIRLFEVIS